MAPAKLDRRAWLLGAVGVAGAASLGAVLGPFRVQLSPTAAVPLVKESFVALGTRVRILVRSGDRRRAQWAIQRAIGAVFEVHAAMTLHDESPLTVLNRRGLSGPVQVPSSLMGVLERSALISQATTGAFDATVSGAEVGMEHVEWDAQEGWVRLHHPGTALDFNGIAKGYAVDRAVQALKAEGLTDFIVNAGGDLLAMGSESLEQPGWSIHLDGPPSSTRPTWTVVDQAVATSGDAFQPEHLRHPVHGVVADAPRTVTIFGPNCMEADGWATAAFVCSRGALDEAIAATGELSGFVVDRTGRTRPIG